MTDFVIYPIEQGYLVMRWGPGRHVGDEVGRFASYAEACRFVRRASA